MHFVSSVGAMSVESVQHARPVRRRISERSNGVDLIPLTFVGGERKDSGSMRVDLLGRVPAAFFSMAVGLFGLGSAWRAASLLWGLPGTVGEAVMAGGGLVWLIIGATYAAKWIWARDAARAEWAHPVQCCFIALAPAATQLAALAARPHARALGLVLFWPAAVGQVAFMIDRSATLWAGGRNPLSTTPVLYLPAVAGSFVTAIVSAAFGYTTLAILSFGTGLFSWAALESVVLHRLLVGEPLERRIMPTLGVQLAPPVIGCVAYLGVTAGAPDRFALMLLGYGMLQAAILVRLAPRFLAQPFAASHWAFTFGASGLALACIRLAARTAPSDGRTGLTSLALAIFLAANILIGAILVRTIVLLMQGELLPAPLTRVTTPSAGLSS
jgi:tellurite resistance protein